MAAIPSVAHFARGRTTPPSARRFRLPGPTSTSGRDNRDFASMTRIARSRHGGSRRRHNDAHEGCSHDRPCDGGRHPKRQGDLQHPPRLAIACRTAYSKTAAHESQRAACRKRDRHPRKHIEEATLMTMAGTPRHRRDLGQDSRPPDGARTIQGA